MTTNEREIVKTAELNFSEAPSSWNTRYISPDGFECQISLRGSSSDVHHRAIHRRSHAPQRAVAV
jgi:hypothetical protein